MKSKAVIKGVIYTFLAVTFTACTNGNLVGAWVEPVPGMPGQQQGFVLESNGRATSINMATLQYETWAQKENLLILSGKSIGNRQTISFTDTLQIVKQTPDSLVLDRGGVAFVYTKTERLPDKVE